METIIAVILTAGAGFSFFYGSQAVNIFVSPDKKEASIQHNESWNIHQFWFNFISSFVGWAAMILLVQEYQKTNGFFVIEIRHIVISIMIIISITGHLPYLISQIIDSFYFLSKKYVGDFYKKS